MGEAVILSKGQPWLHSRDDATRWAERARAAAATLIDAAVNDVAIVGSVSHAISTAARNLAPALGGRILHVADEFLSQRHA